MIPKLVSHSHAKRCAVVAVEMGYGHLRAAAPLARALGTEMWHADGESLTHAEERRLWAWVRHAHESASRATRLPVVGEPMRALLDAVTMIPPLHPHRDLTQPNLTVRALHHLIERGLGSGLVDALRRDSLGLLTTFYAPAIVADRAGIEPVYCVVTDADIHRVWVPLEPKLSRIRYLAPSMRAVRRLEAYGVPRDRVVHTGFPLPLELLGGVSLTALRRNLAARLVRLDPEGTFRANHREELQHFFEALPRDQEGVPPHIVFAVGGAGAQATLADQFLPSFRPEIASQRLRVTLVAGTRSDVADKFERTLERTRLDRFRGRGIDIAFAADFATYMTEFDALLAETDILWTKPSELTFYSALGIPLILAPSLGVHERYNRRWMRDNGVGLKQRDTRYAAGWIGEWLVDGTLAAAAWSGFMRLPKFGTYRIFEQVMGRPWNASHDDAANQGELHDGRQPQRSR